MTHPKNISTLAKRSIRTVTTGIDDLHARALADAMPQIVWTANPDGAIDYYNQHWIDYTGMSIEQTAGWGWDVVLHPDDLQNCIDLWTEAYTSGTQYTIEYRFKRATDGMYRWHLGRALPVRDATGRIIKWFGTCTDIEDQKQALVSIDEQVQLRTAELAEVNASLRHEIAQRELLAQAQQSDSIHLNHIITTQCQLTEAELDLNAFFKLVVSRMDVLTPSTGSAVELVDGDEMVYRAGSGVAAGHIGLRLNRHTSISGLCVKSQVVLRSDDTELDERVDKTACRLLGIRSMVVAPLFHEGVSVGVLKAMAVEPNAFSERDVQTLQLMAGFIGAAIAHQTAFEAKGRLLVELNAAVEAIQASEQRTKTIIESAHDAFISIDASGQIADWNRQSEVTFGWARDEAIGQKLETLIIPERFRSGHLAGMAHYHASGEGKVLNRRIELQGLRRSGQEFPLELTINVIKDGDTTEFCAFLHDITARKLAEESMLHLAQMDQLTGIPNRRLFYDRLEHAMARAKRAKSLMALAYLDIDQFKKINDSHGHLVGDALLKEFSNRLKKNIRAVDTVARLGGDEFIIILEQLKTKTDAMLIAEKIIQGVRPEIHLDHCVLNITTSLGGAFYRDETMSKDDLISLADQALYRAKAAGRNIACWENDLQGNSV